MVAPTLPPLVPRGGRESIVASAKHVPHPMGKALGVRALHAVGSWSQDLRGLTSAATWGEPASLPQFAVYTVTRLCLCVTLVATHPRLRIQDAIGAVLP